jgi:hypothetical protein
MLQWFRLLDRVPKGCVSASAAGLQAWTRSPRPSGGAGSDGCPVIGLQGLDKRLDTAPSSWPRPAAESTTETVLINEANRLTGYVSINRISYGFNCINSVNVSEVCIKNCGLPRISPYPCPCRFENPRQHLSVVRLDERMAPATTTPNREQLVTLRVTAAERKRLNDAAVERATTVASLLRDALADQGIHLSP